MFESLFDKRPLEPYNVDATYLINAQGRLERQDRAELAEGEWEAWKDARIAAQLQSAAALEHLRFQTTGFDSRVGGGITWNRSNR